MFSSFKKVFAICLLAFASAQSAQAMEIVYSSIDGVAGTLDDPATFVVTDVFDVVVGQEYKAMFTDTFANFNSFSMAVFDDSAAPVGSFLSSVSGTPFLSFSFTALTSAAYSVVLVGATESLSTYAATITAVPVPTAIWFFGSAMIALVGVGQRRKV